MQLETDIPDLATNFQSLFTISGQSGVPKQDSLGSFHKLLRNLAYNLKHEVTPFF